MEKDIKIIRNLANRYFEAANSDENKENILRHKRINDLKGDRPIVLIDEIPWHEMNFADELTLQCENTDFHSIEVFLRKSSGKKSIDLLHKEKQKNLEK